MKRLPHGNPPEKEEVYAMPFEACCPRTVWKAPQEIENLPAKPIPMGQAGSLSLEVNGGQGNIQAIVNVTLQLRGFTTSGNGRLP
jgi:hypothetical protein